jgi:hypothetical protein
MLGAADMPIGCALTFYRSSFRGANDVGFTRHRHLNSKSAIADVVGGEPGIHNHDSSKP